MKKGARSDGTGRLLVLPDPGLMGPGRNALHRVGHSYSYKTAGLLITNRTLRRYLLQTGVAHADAFTVEQIVGFGACIHVVVFVATRSLGVLGVAVPVACLLSFRHLRATGPFDDRPGYSYNSHSHHLLKDQHTPSEHQNIVAIS